MSSCHHCASSSTSITGTFADLPATQALQAALLGDSAKVQWNAAAAAARVFSAGQLLSREPGAAAAVPGLADAAASVLRRSRNSKVRMQVRKPGVMWAWPDTRIPGHQAAVCRSAKGAAVPVLATLRLASLWS